MRLSNRTRVLPLVAACVFQLGPGIGGVEATTIASMRLKDLREVSLIVFVDRNIPRFDALEKEITNAAAATLSRAKIASRDSDTSTLLIDVETHGSTALEANKICFSVRVRLKEKVKLARDTAGTLPADLSGVTWSEETVGVESRKNFQSAIIEALAAHLRSFVAEAEAIR